MHAAGGERPLPRFEVRLQAPDLSRWLAGNSGVPGFWSFVAAEPGPHVLLLALTHGNEIAGAIVLDRLLAGGLRPLRGRLSLGFVNLAAFAHFDPARPILSRSIDEDMNRVWDPARLDGKQRSAELTRAREIRSVVESADVVLDLHSMLWPSEPLVLCGPTARGKALALALGTPTLVVADSGHPEGLRIIDHPRFTDPAGQATAVLVEGGQHWQPATVVTLLASVAGLLRATGAISAHPLLPMPPQAPTAPRFATVTATVVPATSAFAFTRPWRGGECVARRDTLIALDGETELRTPYDNCLLVMPNLHASRGHTAVRLARLQPP
jgi:predicted deacylase